MTPIVLDKHTRNFTEMYSDFFPLVYGAVYSKLGNVDDAGDITQEVFARFYDRMGEVENPRRWLFNAMRYVVKEYYCARKGVEISIEEVFEDMGLVFVNGLREARLIIQEALEDMENFRGERERILFDLIAVNCFTFMETGRQLGMSGKGVRRRYRLIVRRLIEYLNRKGIRNLEDLL